MGGRAKESAVGKYEFAVSALVGVGGWSNGWVVANRMLGRATTETQQSDLHVQKWEWGVEWELECACSVSGRECEWESECAGSGEWEAAESAGAAGWVCWGQSCACTDSARERQSQAALNMARAKVNRACFMSAKYSASIPSARRQYYI